jgi:hypothetical protein
LFWQPFFLAVLSSSGWCFLRVAGLPSLSIQARHNFHADRPSGRRRIADACLRSIPRPEQFQVFRVTGPIVLSRRSNGIRGSVLSLIGRYFFDEYAVPSRPLQIGTLDALRVDGVEAARVDIAVGLRLSR